MSVARFNSELQLPDSLQAQLLEFRRRVWTIKLVEAACGAVFGVAVAFIILFALDRVVETATWARVTIFLSALVSCALVPLYMHRWIWRHRRLEQLARLLSRRYPSIGDQILGIIELVRSESEQVRSRALCEAAIQQVAETAAKRDFRDAVPDPRHRMWAWLAAVPLALAVGVSVLFPAAASNAWSRFIRPWEPIPRYTFTRIAELPEHLVVAHGEPLTISVRLLDESRWQPATGVGQLGSGRPVEASLQNGGYVFNLPPQIDKTSFRLQVGDVKQQIRIEPMLRPELSSVVANVQLPDYLQISQPLKKDVRGGSISLVKGSTATFLATANRKLSSARVNGQPATPVARDVSSPPTTVDASRELSISWRDEFGLDGMEPFKIAITARDDEPPAVSCEGLPRKKVVLVSETLSFKVAAQDDFGVKVVGVEWQGDEKSEVSTPARGEQVLAAGSSAKQAVELAGTFLRRRWALNRSRSACAFSRKITFPDANDRTPPSTNFMCSAPSSTISG